MEKITDTQRLNFILQFKPEMDHDWRSGDHWAVFHTDIDGVNRKVVAVGNSYHNVIDNALTGIYKVVD